MLEVSSFSGAVEESAAVYTARLAQLAARRAKKGIEIVSSAPFAAPCCLQPFIGKGDQV